MRVDFYWKLEFWIRVKCHVGERRRSRLYFTPRSPLNAATNTWWVWRVESRQTENKGGIRVVWRTKMKLFEAISPLTSLLGSRTHMIVLVIAVSPQTWQCSKRNACCYRAFRQNVSFWPPTYTHTASVTALALETKPPLWENLPQCWQL